MVPGSHISVLVVGARTRRLAAEASLAGVEILECRDFAQTLPTVRARHARIDAVVVDADTAEAALTLIGSLVREWSWIPVVAVASRGRGPRFIREAFRAGARDVLLRPLGPAELAYALLRLARGGRRALGRNERNVAAVNEVIAAVERSYGHPVSARSLAATAGLSRWRFSRRFHEVTGMSFRAYLAAVRLAHARHLLLSSRRSVTDIAHEVGFYDLPHFDHTFRAWFGMTPLAFRGQAAWTPGGAESAPAGRVPRRRAAARTGPGRTKRLSPSRARATGDRSLVEGPRRAS